jgi:hypothetical protein
MLDEPPLLERYQCIPSTPCPVPVTSTTARAGRSCARSATFDVRNDDRTSINYLAANFIRTFGSGWYDKWTAITLAEIRRLGFNTVANWSDWEIARAARFPYVRPLAWDARAAPFAYRDFPDVFDETPGSGMLFNTPRCATRRALADALARKYGDDRGTASATTLASLTCATVPTSRCATRRARS